MASKAGKSKGWGGSWIIVGIAVILLAVWAAKGFS